MKNIKKFFKDRPKLVDGIRGGSIGALIGLTPIAVFTVLTLSDPFDTSEIDYSFNGRLNSSYDWLEEEIQLRALQKELSRGERYRLELKLLLEIKDELIENNDLSKKILDELRRLNR